MSRPSGPVSMTPNWSACERGTRIPATVTAAPDCDVLLDHLGRVHPVDVVGAEDDDVLRPLVVDEVEALEDGVGAALVPARPEPLLGRHRGDVVAEQVGHPPGRGDVPVEAVRLVLREHAEPQVAAVDQVGQHEVDQPVLPAERHRGLGPVGRQRHQPLALAAGQDDPEDASASPWPHPTLCPCGSAC